MSNKTNETMRRISEDCESFSSAAKLYLQIGFAPIPLDHESLNHEVDLDTWAQGVVDKDKNAELFAKHHNDATGLLLCGPLVAFQTTTQNADQAFWQLMQKHGPIPKFITDLDGTKTYLFGVEEGAMLPEELLLREECRNLLVKTEYQTVPVPPTSGVKLESAWFSNAKDLDDVGQDFLDDLCLLFASKAEPQKPDETPHDDADSTVESAVSHNNTLAAYGINKHVEAADQNMQPDPVLGGFIMRGEMTTIHADSNCGKTLLMFALIQEAIKKGFKIPTFFGYVNKDDSGLGLQEKVAFANTLGVNVIADVDGRSFGKKALIGMLRKIIRSGEAPNSVVVIDTLKKFVRVNDKDNTVAFYNAVRPYTLAGGTIVFIAHNNKFKVDGKSVNSGTSDHTQDVDAAYSMEIISEGNETHSERIIELECTKKRIASPEKIMFSYNANGNLSWSERLNTIRQISGDEYSEILVKCARQKDSEVLHSLSETLRIEGQMHKMKLVKSVCDDTGRSRNEVLRVLDFYTGSDPSKHDWNYEVVHRGAKTYSLLDKMTDD